MNENPQTIEITKVVENDEEKGTLIEKLPYLTHITDSCDKWDFIEKYWNNNYGKFE